MRILRQDYGVLRILVVNLFDVLIMIRITAERSTWNTSAICPKASVSSFPSQYSVPHVPRGTLKTISVSVCPERDGWFLASVPRGTFPQVHQNTALNSQVGSNYSGAQILQPKNMGRVIAVANQKGGVGKTTTAINLAASLAAAEVNTLLVDCDPQSNATSGFGLRKDPERISTYHVIIGAASADEALQLTELEQLWVIPSHKNLIGANLELVEAERREFRLRDALAPLRDRFQFVVLDCPPALDLLTVNALVAADGVLIPMQAEYFALEGVSELLDTVERIRVALNPPLAVEGVVLTMFDERTNLAQQVAQELQKYFGEKLLNTAIPRNIRLAEAPSHGKPALIYDVRSRGAESYIRLAKELLDRYAAARNEAGAGAGAA